jgi:hypothetical protein
MAKKLLDQLREELRLKHYSYRTEQAYVDWVRCFILLRNYSAWGGWILNIRQLDMVCQA